MRSGNVVTIRVNPQDSMAVVDIARLAGLEVRGMSFPSMVSVVLSSLLETVRETGSIPTRDGFEYLDIMKDYLMPRRSKRKLEVSDLLYKTGTEFKLPTIKREVKTQAPIKEVQVEETVKSPPEDVSHLTPEQLMELRHAQLTLRDLMTKQDLAKDPSSGVVFSAEDQQRWDAAYKVVYEGA